MRIPHLSEKLSSSYFEALGRLLVAFQAVEEAVTYGIVQLTRSDRANDVDLQYFLALSELPFRGRVKLLRNFLETTKPSHYLWKGCPAEEKRKKLLPQILTQMLTFAKDCNSLEDDRNQLTHSIWEPTSEALDATATRFKLRVQDKKTLVVQEEVPLQRILDLVERMQATRNGLENGGLLLASLLAEKRENAL